jgi:hypothetical protein
MASEDRNQWMLAEYTEGSQPWRSPPTASEDRNDSMHGPLRYTTEAALVLNGERGSQRPTTLVDRPVHAGGARQR